MSGRRLYTTINDKQEELIEKAVKKGLAKNKAEYLYHALLAKFKSDGFFNNS